LLAGLASIAYGIDREDIPSFGLGVFMLVASCVLFYRYYRLRRSVFIRSRHSGQIILGTYDQKFGVKRRMTRDFLALEEGLELPEGSAIIPYEQIASVAPLGWFSSGDIFLLVFPQYGLRITLQNGSEESLRFHSISDRATFLRFTAKKGVKISAKIG